MPGLGGRVVACLEARYATELADLVTRHGGISYPAPCLREVHEPDAEETRRAVDLLCGETVDAAVFLTGVGANTIVDCASRLDRTDALLAGLARKRVAARGPKAQNALRRYGVKVDLLAPEPFTSAVLLEEIERAWDLRSQTVLVQRYGAPVPLLTEGLARLGALVEEVSPYRWERPLDEDAVVRLIDDLAEGWIDVLAATNATQVDHLVQIARDRGRADELERAWTLPRLRIAAQGVVCAEAFRRHGVRVDILPPRASMGALVLEIARRVVTMPTDTESTRTDGRVALLVSPDVEARELDQVLDQLGPGSTVGVLSGRSRHGERSAERAAIERGFALEQIRPVCDGRHPADELVRWANTVFIVARRRRVGALLQLANRYAKPVRVIRLA